MSLTSATHWSSTGATDSRRRRVRVEPEEVCLHRCLAWNRDIRRTGEPRAARHRGLGIYGSTSGARILAAFDQRSGGSRRAAILRCQRAHLVSLTGAATIGTPLLAELLHSPPLSNRANVLCRAGVLHHASLPTRSHCMAVNMAFTDYSDIYQRMEPVLDKRCRCGRPGRLVDRGRDVLLSAVSADVLAGQFTQAGDNSVRSRPARKFRIVRSYSSSASD